MSSGYSWNYVADAGEPAKIIVVRSKAALEEFIDFGYRLRRTDAHFVPPLRRDIRTLLDRNKHPFHEHAEVEYFLARRHGKTVGRIAAIENFAHNATHNERIGFFGFLEAVDDPVVFRGLLRAAEKWAAKRGLTALRGPCSFSTNEECGLLVDNFQSEPYIMMPHNPPYYPRFVEESGYERIEDLVCFWLIADRTGDRLFKLADRAEQRITKAGDTVTTRRLDTSNFAREVEIVKDLYNRCWEKNWGFVPLTDNEMNFLAKELRPIVEPGLVMFVEVNGKPAGFALALPDYNTILRFLDGKLGPAQIALFLLLRKKIKRFRMLMMGVLPEFRNRGVELVLYRDFGSSAKSLGYQEGEFSWVLDERNPPMKHQIETLGGELYRRYRLYEKPLG